MGFDKYTLNYIISDIPKTLKKKYKKCNFRSSSCTQNHYTPRNT